MLPQSEDHFNISLLEAVLVKEPCFACRKNANPDDVYVIGIYLPHQKVIYFHDDECFDSFLAGLNQFDSLRETMRLSNHELLN